MTKRVIARGVRQRGPSGYVVGRLDRGDGQQQLIAIADLGSHLVQTGVVQGANPAGGGTHEEILTLSAAGPFTAGQQFTIPPAPRAATFPDATDVSTATSTVAATSHSIFYLCTDLTSFLALGAPNGVLASIDFAAGASVGTVTYFNGGTIVQGQVLTLVCPAGADATLSGVHMAFYGDL